MATEGMYRDKEVGNNVGYDGNGEGEGGERGRVVHMNEEKRWVRGGGGQREGDRWKGIKEGKVGGTARVK